MKGQSFRESLNIGMLQLERQPDVQATRKRATQEKKISNTAKGLADEGKL